MPTSNSSPVKRPGLGRRAVSSHAVVTRTSQQNELADLHTSHQKLPLRPHRPHVVGGHRNHHRNPSHGKNLAKFQRHTSHTSVHLPETTTTGRYHQRKKSAPATPATSPRGQHHVRWDGAVDSHPTTASMKKNNSSPALRRNNSGGVVGKKTLVTSRPNSSSGKKKTVGFELADSDNDDGDWEDTTQSPESTRRSSVAQSKESVENAAVLVDPLTFVKRPYPQFPRATSLPESTSKSFGEGHLPDEDDDSDNADADDSDTKTTRPSQNPEEQEEAAVRVPDHADIANRLLSPSHSAKAPPAMSSISATVKPTAVDSISRNTSLSNIATGPDGLRRPLSSSNQPLANTPGTPGTPAQATSSSIEGGVSRFIKTGINASVRTDSDPNTPSSFLPHYHPQTPPSPNRAPSSRRSRASPPTRPPGTEPPSRTQQKLWLQRTAALNTSPPDTHGVSTTVSPSTIDANYATRTGAGPFDPGRGLVNGSARSGGVVHDNETKHIRKAYEKTSLELTVVRRFQSPTGDSFRRLNFILNDLNGPNLGHQRHPSSLGKPIKSAPALTQLQDGKQQKPGQNTPSPEPKQLMSRRQAPIRTSSSQTYLQDPEELVNDSTEPGQPAKPLQHPSHRILSASDDAHSGPAVEEVAPDAVSPYFSNETEMMIRRIWESREVPESG